MIDSRLHMHRITTSFVTGSKFLESYSQNPKMSVFVFFNNYRIVLVSNP